MKTRLGAMKKKINWQATEKNGWFSSLCSWPWRQSLGAVRTLQITFISVCESLRLLLHSVIIPGKFCLSFMQNCCFKKIVGRFPHVNERMDSLGRVESLGKAGWKPSECLLWEWVLRKTWLRLKLFSFRRECSRIFGEDGLTLKLFLKRTAPFSILWTLTNYLYLLALKKLTATDVSALFCCNKAFVFLLSWIVLKDRFMGARVMNVPPFPLSHVFIIALKPISHGVLLHWGADTPWKPFPFSFMVQPQDQLETSETLREFSVGISRSYWSQV